MACWLLVLLLLSLPVAVPAQPWVGTIATSRATDWSLAGVQGGIPSATWPYCDNANCTALAPGGAGAVTAATINAAISGAQSDGVTCSISAPCVVRLRAGSFTLTAGLNMKSGVAVRGAGPGTGGTLLDINGTASNSCSYATWSAAVSMCGGGFFSTIGPVDWSAGYAPGTTTITLPSCTNIVPGVTPLHLQQLNEIDGYPALGDLFICDSGGTCNSEGPGGAGLPGGMGTAGRAPAMEVLATACTNGQVTITPPIALPNFRAGQSPQAQYPASLTLAWAGLEDISIDHTDAGNAGIEWINTSNTWIRGVRLVNSGTASYGIALGRSSHITIRDSYIYRAAGTEQGNYAVSLMAVGSLLYENNICQGPSCVHATSDNSLNNSVFAYNFTAGHTGPNFIRHLAGENMNLIEGNVLKGVWSDAEDGTGCCYTVFRNAFIGDRYNNGAGSTIESAVMLVTNSRFWNVVGNVLGDASLWSVYQGQTNGGCSTSSHLYDLGGTSCGGGSVVADPRVAATLFRWGNWDEITSTSPGTNGDQTGVRWCGNAANTGWTTRCGSVTEVPSGIANFANPIPATETLPASAYLTTQPAWWPGSIPWPPIGPEVSGGNISNMGGHAYLNPAAACYFTVMGGPTNGSGSPLTFDPSICYVLSETPAVAVVATDATAAEPSGDNGLFTVSRTGATTGALVVNCAISGTATPTDDYTAISCPVTIPDGQASTTVAVTVQNDVLAGEGTETVIFTITAAGAGEYTIGTSSATVNITDDDPLVSVTATDGTAGEPTNNGVFTLSCDMACTLTVNCTLSGTASAGSDYTAISCPRALVNSDAITVAVLDDGIPEATKNVIFTITAGSGYGIGTNPAQITLTDDDAVVLGGGRFSGQGTLQ